MLMPHIGIEFSVGEAGCVVFDDSVALEFIHTRYSSTNSSNAVEPHD